MRLGWSSLSRHLRARRTGGAGGATSSLADIVSARGPCLYDFSPCGAGFTNMGLIEGAGYFWGSYILLMTLFMAEELRDNTMQGILVYLYSTARYVRLRDGAVHRERGAMAWTGRNDSTHSDKECVAWGE